MGTGRGHSGRPGESTLVVGGPLGENPGELPELSTGRRTGRGQVPGVLLAQVTGLSREI